MSFQATNSPDNCPNMKLPMKWNFFVFGKKAALAIFVSILKKLEANFNIPKIGCQHKRLELTYGTVRELI
jgi:hypothetical protein